MLQKTFLKVLVNASIKIWTTFFIFTKSALEEGTLPRVIIVEIMMKDRHRHCPASKVMCMLCLGDYLSMMCLCIFTSRKGANEDSALCELSKKNHPSSAMVKTPHHSL